MNDNGIEEETLKDIFERFTVLLAGVRVLL